MNCEYLMMLLDIARYFIILMIKIVFGVLHNLPIDQDIANDLSQLPLIKSDERWFP